MPIEYAQLKDKDEPFETCPKCKKTFKSLSLMRGTIQRSKRFLWILWKQDYCTIICNKCEEVVGWESP